MPVINSLSTSSIKKLKRVSDKVTTTPQSTGINNRRRLGGTQGEGVAIAVTPFKMSLTKNEEDEQLVTIGLGQVFIDETEYIINQNSVNIDSYSEGDKVYIYLKLVSSWETNNQFQGFPVLTVKEGDEIENTNFASNSVRFPNTDAGNYFYSIGYVDVTEVNNVKSYKITQISLDNSTFESYPMESFRVNRIFREKSTDEEDDVNYDLWTNGGQIITPDSADNLSSIKELIEIDGELYIYAEVSATQTSNGGWTNFSSDIITSPTPKANEDDFYYIQIAYMNGALLNQGLTGTIDSGGKVY